MYKIVYTNRMKKDAKLISLSFQLLRPAVMRTCLGNKESSGICSVGAEDSGKIMM